MGAGCSTERNAQANPASPTARTPSAKSGPVRSTSAKSLANARGSIECAHLSRRTREELAAQFVAEYPQDDEAAPSYPEGSREATLLKIFNLLDKGGTGSTDVHTWRDFVQQAGITTEELARELAIIVADQPAGTEGDPRVSAAQYVAGMARMTANLDDPAFGRFVAQSLTAYRTGKQASTVADEPSAS